MDLTVNDFAKIFGIEEKDMPEECKDLINSKDFKYEYFSKQDRDKIIIDFLEKIRCEKFSISGKDKIEKWKMGWQESLEEFVKSNFDSKKLIPKYNHCGSPVRVFGDFVKSSSNTFENDFIEVIRMFVFYSYLIDKQYIYEFGCGTGLSLFEFAKRDNNKEYHGLDWVPQSKKIIEFIKEKYGYNINGHVFDMFEPNYNLNIEADSVLFTWGALEQLGTDFDDFLNFMLDKPFSRYVHLNSILEEYDIDNNIVDYLTYHQEKNRNYLNGYFTKLKQLEKDGKINILKMHKVSAGGLLNEGYSISVWEKA